MQVSIIPGEPEVVRSAFVLRANGATLQAFADELNTPGGTGRTWYPFTARHMLSNGVVYRGGRPHWPATLGG